MVFAKMLSFLSGDSDKSTLKKCEKFLPEINAHYQNYFDNFTKYEQFAKKTAEFKNRLKENKDTLDSLLPEAFGLVKAAAHFLKKNKHSWQVRGTEMVWDLVHYDVQLLGGIILHQGKIAEMKTGEGKTLVCTLPIFLNALTEEGVFLVTANEYLAQRDQEWMSGLYNILGLSVGTIVNSQSAQQKQEIYQRDIIYGTNNEFGFDYLRDNMARSKEEVVQRKLYYAIVDEVDSILIDEARTPLIISAPAEESTKKYEQYSKIVQQLTENEDYNIDEKQKVATLSETGIKKIEKILKTENIYTEHGYKEIHHLEQALKAKSIFKKDTDYMIKDGEIVIIDSFTGRLMPGRRYSDGLHQAIEAKEKVKIQKESKTLAQVTFQNYFRLFDKLAGMTGTAKTEEEEFFKIYGLSVVAIPTNKPILRDDLQDLIFRSYKGKITAIATQVKELTQKGQPVLIGTVSVEQSETLSKLLKLHGVKHNVLNAKNHEREAEIIASAGEKNSVTIATNMAGRGTDIKLGEGVLELGGLYVIGTERHESRRIDNQLRGRSGRQGDKGTTQFYISMDDELMRIFGGERVKKMMETLNMPEEVPITNKFINNSIENAQKRVEGRNFDIRKHIVEYDDVINYHREIIYKKRHKILFEENIKNEILLLIEKEAEATVLNHKTVNNSFDYQEIYEITNTITPTSPKFLEELKEIQDKEALIDKIKKHLWRIYEQNERKILRLEQLRVAEKQVYLNTIDVHWMEHIDSMSYLRQNVALHAYGQKDPLLEYKDQGYKMFQSLLATIQSGVINTLFKITSEQNRPF